MHLLETLALYGLLVIIAMRPLVSETYESALTRIDIATGALGSTTPATTAAFDLGILLCSLAGAWAAVLRRERWQWTGLETGWLLMLAGAVVSTWAAGNKRLAMNASADWLITTLIIFVLANLCRTRRRVALVLIVITASGAASLAKDAMLVVSELPETREHYFQNKKEFWARQGVALDDPQVELFERRIRGTAATGFFPHSNVQAALLVLCGCAALALAGLTWPHRGGRIACIGLGVALLAGTLLTASKGGILSALIGLALTVPAWRRAGSIRLHWRKVLLAGWGLVGLGVAAVLLVGWMRGGLPGASLQFRWEYWNITRQIVADRPWTGEGAQNFDRAYLLRKPIEYPEEIKDPHNFVLSMAAQWGVLGGAGLLWMLLAGSRAALRRAAAASLDDASLRDGGPLVRRALALMAGFVVLRLALLRDYWLSEDPGSVALVLLDLELYGLLWAALAGALLWLVSRPSGQGESKRAIEEGPELRLRLALLCGAVGFLLHNLVEFALFYPGTLTVFAALVGLLMRPPSPVGQSAGVPGRRAGAIAAATITLGLVSFLWLVYLPVTRTSGLLSQARSAASPETAEQALRDATVLDRFDPTAPAELAGLYAQHGGTSHALEMLKIALQRDPMDVNLYKLAATAHSRHFQTSQDPADLHAAIRAARTALSLYPASPDGHVFLGGVLADAAEALNSTELAAEAARVYQRALDLDAARPGTDEVRRWPLQRRRDIQQRAEEAIRRRPATTTTNAPAA